MIMDHTTCNIYSLIQKDFKHHKPDGSLDLRRLIVCYDNLIGDDRYRIYRSYLYLDSNYRSILTHLKLHISALGFDNWNDFREFMNVGMHRYGVWNSSLLKLAEERKNRRYKENAQKKRRKTKSIN